MNKQVLNLSFLSILLTLFVISQVMANKNLKTSAQSKSVKKRTCYIDKTKVGKLKTKNDCLSIIDQAM